MPLWVVKILHLPAIYLLRSTNSRCNKSIIIVSILLVRKSVLADMLRRLVELLIAIYILEIVPRKLDQAPSRLAEYLGW